MTTRSFTAAVTSNTSQLLTFVHRERLLTLASQTQYFLNAKTATASMTGIHFNGGIDTTVIRAICAYL